MTQSSIVRSITVTTVVTVGVALAIFLVVRMLFPDPPIEGSFCPSSLPLQEQIECVKRWPESHHDRYEHRLISTLAIVLASVAAARVLALPRVGLGAYNPALALALASGFFAVWSASAIFLLSGEERIGWVVLFGSALFAAAACLVEPTLSRFRLAIAGIVGAGLFLIAGVVWMIAFYRGN